MAKNTKSKCPEVTDELIREIVENWEGTGEGKYRTTLDQLGGLPTAKDFVNRCILALSEMLFLEYASKCGLINPDPEKIPLVEAKAKEDLEYRSKKWFIPIHSGPDFPDTKDEDALTVMRARRFWIIGKQDFSPLLDTQKAKLYAEDIADGIALLKMEGAILKLNDTKRVNINRAKHSDGPLSKLTISAISFFCDKFHNNTEARDKPSARGRILSKLKLVPLLYPTEPDRKWKEIEEDIKYRTPSNSGKRIGNYWDVIKEHILPILNSKDAEDLKQRYPEEFKVES